MFSFLFPSFMKNCTAENKAEYGCLEAELEPTSHYLQYFKFRRKEQEQLSGGSLQFGSKSAKIGHQNWTKAGFIKMLAPET